MFRPIKDNGNSYKTNNKAQKISSLFIPYFPPNLLILRRMFVTVLSLIALAMSLISAAEAAAYSGIVFPGDAVVTGLSGVSKQTNTEEFFILTGPSVRVITLPSSGPFGLRDASKHFTVTARDVGQVFGVTLDSQSQPDIFVAATSAYGLAIYKPGKGRLKTGEPGAQFMRGQFGPADQGGGPGSIWRIDGKTGKVTLFTNVIYQGIENSPTALGALAFDPTSQQLFVSDRATGMIHSFSPDGTERGTFDHGVQGLAAAGQAQVPFDSSTVANIKNPSFDTENPETWGYAPVERRVFALAVYKHRLFYSVAVSQIWSVGIAADGAFADDARFEVDVPALKPGTEVSSIAFDDEGLMYVAERAAPTGHYDFINVADGGQKRVKRFAPKTNTDASPGLWIAPGDQYAISMLPQYQNADGGVDIKCNRIVWATGDHLLDPGNSYKKFPHIDGLQGTDKKLVEPANMPPEQSWYINYYDVEANSDSTGHMGALDILNICEGVTPTPPVTPPKHTCPDGSYLIDCKCLVPPICPYGTIFRDGYCIFEQCPWGFVEIDNVCVKPPIECGYGKVYIQNHCVSIPCPPGLAYATKGYCRCPNDWYFIDGQCIPSDKYYIDPLCKPCPPYHRWIDNKCVPWCPPYQRFIDGKCIPWCPPHQRYVNDHCVPVCPDDQRYENGKCVPPCPPNQHYRDGRCVPDCPPNQRYIDGRCIPGCPPYQHYVDGRCIPGCPSDQHYVNGKCVPSNPCSHGQVYIDGKCITPPICKTNEVLRNGRCIPIPIIPVCKTGERLLRGKCIPIETKHCLGNQILINGSCTTPIKVKPHLCPTGQTYRNGNCVSTGTTNTIKIKQIKPSNVIYKRTPTYNTKLYKTNTDTNIKTNIKSNIKTNIRMNIKTQPSNTGGSTVIH